MIKKPISNIIPRIHNLEDCWFIQWIGNEYYIKKGLWKRFFNLYSVINFVVLIFVWNTANAFPINGIEDIKKMFILSILTGIMNGIAVIEDKEFRD